MALYILSYVKNMEFRAKIKEDVTKETIEELKKMDIDICYITQVYEEDPDVKKLLGIYKRTKKFSLKDRYLNDISTVCGNLGSKHLTVVEFFKK